MANALRATRNLAFLSLVVVVLLFNERASMSLAAAPPPPPGPAKQAPCATAPDATFSMLVPLAHARYFGGGDLMLNNRGIVAHSVVTTWYVEGRGPIVGPTISLPASQANFYPIADFLPAGVRLDDVNALDLTYEGKQREVWAQAV